MPKTGLKKEINNKLVIRIHENEFLRMQTKKTKRIIESKASLE